MKVILAINPDTPTQETHNFRVDDVIYLAVDSAKGEIAPAFVQCSRYERERDVIPTLYINTLVVRPHLTSIVHGELYVSVITLPTT